jgi:hypothetical protein
VVAFTLASLVHHVQKLEEAVLHLA